MKEAFIAISEKRTRVQSLSYAVGSVELSTLNFSDISSFDSKIIPYLENVLLQKKELLEITDFEVLPKYRKQGFGKDILSEVVKDNPNSTFFLTVLPYCSPYMTLKQLAVWYVLQFKKLNVKEIKLQKTFCMNRKAYNLIALF